jgi:hypothetical protein
MARHKDTNWNFADKLPDMDSCILAALMDLRDELKTINLILGYGKFGGIASQIDRIVNNTAKPRNRKKK